MSTIDIRYSKDGGSNWSDWRRLDIGETGDFVNNVQAHRFGRGVQWVFDIRLTDPIPCDLLGACLKLEQTDS